MLLLLLGSAALLCCAHTSPLAKDALEAGGNSIQMAVTPPPDLALSARSKRNSRIIEDCMVVGLEEGTYYHKSRGGSQVCGVYLLSQPDQIVHVSLDYLNADCDSQGLLSFVDGWELGGEVFPSEVDAPLSGRVHEFCGRLRKKVLRSSDNAALIQYRLPVRGDGFRITVRYTKNPAPCNILVDAVEGVYTLRNHGRRSNCTLTAIFPASVALLQLAVGVAGPSPVPNRAIETGVLSRCEKRGARDFVQIGGGLGLDSTKMEVEDSVCGLDSNPRLPPSHIVCGMTSVRLVSSGMTDNSITLALSQLTDPSLTPSLFCDMPL